VTVQTVSQRLGFPSQKPVQALGATPTPPMLPAPAPPPKRPKGRWFIGLALLAIGSYAGSSIWNSFLRFEAYGVIDGRSIELAAPWSGEVRYLHVREGDTVRQGDRLVTLDNIELRQRVATLSDELRVAQATLEAEGAKLRWQTAVAIDHDRGAMANYFEAVGSLLHEESRLDELRLSRERAEKLFDRAAIAQDEVDRLRISEEGQIRRIAKLREALAELKKRAELADAMLQQGSTLDAGLTSSGIEQLKPFVARIESLQAEKSRLQERLGQCEVRAPSGGLVVRRHRYAGERCREGEPLVSLIQEGSLEIVLYMPQRSSAKLSPGNRVSLIVDPYREPLECTVVRLGDQFAPPPEQIKRQYHEGQRLLPVHLVPRDDSLRWAALRLGGVVKLPYSRLDLISMWKRAD
jgi:multidrug resistance efflux pump